MAAISVLNPKAEIARASHSLAINMSAARGLQEILKSNLGPKGTMKMWVKSEMKSATKQKQRANQFLLNIFKGWSVVLVILK